MGQILSRLKGAYGRRPAILFGSAFSLSAGILFYLVTQSWIENDARQRFVNHTLRAQSNLEARIKSYSDLVRAAASMFHANAPISRAKFHDFVAGLNLPEQFPAVEVINYAEYILDRDRAALEQRLREDYAAEESSTGKTIKIQPPGNRPSYAILTVAEPGTWLKTVGLDLLGNRGEEVRSGMLRMADNGKLSHSGQPIPAITGPNRTGLGMRLPVYRSNMPTSTAEERRAAYMGSMGIAFSVHKLVRGILQEMRVKNVRMTLIDASPTDQARSLPALAGGRVLFDSKGSDQLPAPALDADPSRYFTHSVTTNLHGRTWKAVFSIDKNDFYTDLEAYLPALAMLAGVVSAALLYALYHTLSSSRQRALAIASEMTRELRESEAQLVRSRDHLRRLAAHAEQIKEGERKRIAREIHDDLGQNLLALRIEADMLRSRTGNRHPRLHERASSTLAHIDATIKSVRQIINDLRPHVLDLGLVAAAEWQIGEFRRRTGIACELLSDNLENVAVNDHCATAYFRILQESLNNIAHHARATMVRVELALDRRVPYRLSMTVSDNGIGLPPAGPRPGSFGLVGIEERIVLLGGSFLIDSSPGNGTTLSVSVPLNIASQRDAYVAESSAPEPLPAA